MSTQQNHDKRHQSLQELKGFDPSRGTNLLFGCFTKAEAQNSLFGSTQSTPVPVVLADDEEGVSIPLVIDLARPLYDPRIIGKGQEHPDWYFEGWIVPSGFVPNTTIKRIRVVVSTLGSEFSDDDIFNWQYILDNEPLADETLHWSFP